MNWKKSAFLDRPTTSCGVGSILVGALTSAKIFSAHLLLAVSSTSIDIGQPHARRSFLLDITPCTNCYNTIVDIDGVSSASRQRYMPQRLHALFGTSAKTLSSILNLSYDFILGAILLRAPVSCGTLQHLRWQQPYPCLVLDSRSTRPDAVASLSPCVQPDKSSARRRYRHLHLSQS